MQTESLMSDHPAYNPVHSYDWNNSPPTPLPSIHPCVQKPKIVPHCFFNGVHLLLMGMKPYQHRHHLCTCKIAYSWCSSPILWVFHLPQKYTDKRKSCLIPLFVSSESLQHTPAWKCPNSEYSIQCTKFGKHRKTPRKRIPKSDKCCTWTYTHTGTHHTYIIIL